MEKKYYATRPQKYCVRISPFLTQGKPCHEPLGKQSKLDPQQITG